MFTYNLHCLFLLSLKLVSFQVGKLEVDGRGLKISSRLLSREVGELKTMTSTLSDELASSVEEVSNNMDKQGQHIRAHMQDTLLKHRQDSKEDLQSTLENVLVARERGEVTHACSHQSSGRVSIINIVFMSKQ